jgi:hypothetical protein
VQNRLAVVNWRRPVPPADIPRCSVIRALAAPCPGRPFNAVFYHLLHAREAGLKKPLTGVIFEQFCVTHVPSQDSHRFMPRLISQFENGSSKTPKRVATGRISPHREETESNAARGKLETSGGPYFKTC